MIWDQAWLQPNILGGVQLGAKHQEDPHTAPKALRQGSGGAAPGGGLGGRAPMWGVKGGEAPRKILHF